MDPVRQKILDQIQHMADHAVIINRRYLDDEQLIRSEQLEVLDTVFNANIRDAEIREITAHFAPLFRNDHPVHLAVWGKTGTGKTMTIIYVVNLLQELSHKRDIEMRFVHLDLATPRPCFRALNDLACLLNASKRYTKGVSLHEMMTRIETALVDFTGYLVLFVDEVDNVRRDQSSFLTFLVRRLPQNVRCKIILIFASNHLDWCEGLDPRIQSFLKMNELIFEPYNASDLQHILRIRVERAMRPGAVEDGVIEKIAAMASRNHGDARQAVALLGRSAHLAEKNRGTITLGVVDQAASQIDQDRYICLVRSAPRQLQAAISAVMRRRCSPTDRATMTTMSIYKTYTPLCQDHGMQPLTYRAFSDLLSELDLYGLIHTRIQSHGRHGRNRQITVPLPDQLIEKIQQTLKTSLT